MPKKKKSTVDNRERIISRLVGRMREFVPRFGEERNQESVRGTPYAAIVAPTAVFPARPHKRARKKKRAA